MLQIKRRLVIRAKALINQLLEPISKPLEELGRADVARLNSVKPNPLLSRGRRHFSQNDEDGILLEILRRLDISQPSVFIEFGVGDGTENNTIILLALRWRGVWVDGEKLAFQLPAKGTRLIFLQRWITKDNAAIIAQEGLAALAVTLQDVRVASVDLDGNDGHVVRTLLSSGMTPDVFIVEYNAKFPPRIEFEMPYNEKYSWQGDDFFGVSLQKWVTVFAPAGYSLVACNEYGVNAFFVKTSHLSRFADVPSDIEDLYRGGYYRRYPTTGHPTSPQTIQHLATD